MGGDGLRSHLRAWAPPVWLRSGALLAGEPPLPAKGPAPTVARFCGHVALKTVVILAREIGAEDEISQALRANLEQRRQIQGLASPLWEVTHYIPPWCGPLAPGVTAAVVTQSARVGPSQWPTGLAVGLGLRGHCPSAGGGYTPG